MNIQKYFKHSQTALLLALGYLIFLFAGVVEDVVNSESIVSIDEYFNSFIIIFRDPSWIKIFTLITWLGTWEAVALISVITIAILWKEKRLQIAPLMVSLGGSAVFTYMSKIVFHRARPEGAIYQETLYSFPSGHATIAIALYGFITYLLIRYSKTYTQKSLAFISGLALIILIGFSRLYLGVHYLSDIWGGYLAGAIWLVIAISLTKYLHKNLPQIKIEL